MSVSVDSFAPLQLDVKVHVPAKRPMMRRLPAGFSHENIA